MLQLIDISKTFNPGTVNEKKALSHLNLELQDGDFATIIGSNGAKRTAEERCRYDCLSVSQWNQ